MPELERHDVDVLIIGAAGWGEQPWAEPTDGPAAAVFAENGVMARGCATSLPRPRVVTGPQARAQVGVRPRSATHVGA